MCGKINKGSYNKRNVFLRNGSGRKKSFFLKKGSSKQEINKKFF
jgi:hypothetical protein